MQINFQEVETSFPVGYNFKVPSLACYLLTIMLMKFNNDIIGDVNTCGVVIFGAPGETVGLIISVYSQSESCNWSW